jgi:hypothetical protein
MAAPPGAEQTSTVNCKSQFAFYRSPTNWGQGRQAENDLAPRVPELSFRASARHGSFVDDLSQLRLMGDGTGGKSRG